MRKSTRSSLVVSIAFHALLSVSISQAEGGVPVMVGGAAELDACGASGEVRGLDPNGDGFLAVRSGPGTEYLEIDRLHNGDAVFYCDEKRDWIGVVYGEYGADCGVSSPMSKRQPYNGPCKSGWAYRKWLVLTAG